MKKIKFGTRNVEINITDQTIKFGTNPHVSPSIVYKILPKPERRKLRKLLRAKGYASLAAMPTKQVA